jgi:hypothetical protein
LPSDITLFIAYVNNAATCFGPLLRSLSGIKTTTAYKKCRQQICKMTIDKEANPVSEHLNISTNCKYVKTNNFPNFIKKNYSKFYP